MQLGSLVLMRHAKSSYPAGVADHDRPLNNRGERDAHAAGIWLSENQDIWQGNSRKVLVSSALRAQQTWKIAAGSFQVDHRDEPRIYEAAVSTLISLVDIEIRNGTDVLLVGHNPGLEELALFLTRHQITPARMIAEAKFPTSGIAVLRILDESWSDASAVLESFTVPRGTQV